MHSYRIPPFKRLADAVREDPFLATRDMELSLIDFFSTEILLLTCTWKHLCRDLYFLPLSSCNPSLSILSVTKIWPQTFV